MDVMVDIESLGTTGDSVLVSIGAVKFDNLSLGETFYEEIDIQSAQDHGLSIDADTLLWWLSQTESVQSALPGGSNIVDVLEDFADFIDDTDHIWAKPPSFDCDLIRDAYDAVGLDVPWHYRDERCHRTLLALPINPDVERTGEHHNALDDARHQAKQARRILADLND